MAMPETYLIESATMRLRVRVRSVDEARSAAE